MHRNARNLWPERQHGRTPLTLFWQQTHTLQVEGHDWVRHRKITAPPFNERNSGLVWAESLRQAQGMLDWWKNHDSKGVKSTALDTRILSLHVLASAGFGTSYSFASAREPSGSAFAMTYREALSLILEYTLVVIAVPKLLLKYPVVPKNWARASQATTEFRRHMTNMLEREKHLISQRAPGAANLMSSLVRGSEEAQQAITPDDKDCTVLKGLTDDEIYGNLFLYNFAGHETTGNLLTYSILLLAAYPQWQAWLAEEIEEVFGGQPYNQAWDYNQFPRLKRCRAVMVSDLPSITSLGVNESKLTVNRWSLSDFTVLSSQFPNTRTITHSFLVSMVKHILYPRIL